MPASRTGIACCANTNSCQEDAPYHSAIAQTHLLKGLHYLYAGEGSQNSQQRSSKRLAGDNPHYRSRELAPKEKAQAALRVKREQVAGKQVASSNAGNQRARPVPAFSPLFKNVHRQARTGTTLQSASQAHHSTSTVGGSTVTTSGRPH